MLRLERASGPGGTTGSRRRARPRRDRTAPRRVPTPAPLDSPATCSLRRRSAGPSSRRSAGAPLRPPAPVTAISTCSAPKVRGKPCGGWSLVRLCFGEGHGQGTHRARRAPQYGSQRPNPPHPTGRRRPADRRSDAGTPRRRARPGAAAPRPLPRRGRVGPRGGTSFRCGARQDPTRGKSPASAREPRGGASAPASSAPRPGNAPRPRSSGAPGTAPARTNARASEANASPPGMSAQYIGLMPSRSLAKTSRPRR